MDKSSVGDVPLAQQREAWNRWNAHAREVSVGPISRRQADEMLGWLDAAGVRAAEILDVGCGTGWMCERLLPYGSVTGIDLAHEVLDRARARLPQVRFLAGDLDSLDLPRGGFDVVVSLEVLAHVADQPRFLQRIAALLRPGGLLLLATQNRPVLERWSEIGAPIPGTHRHWVDARALRELLAPAFRVQTLTSIAPVGDQGLLRLANSVKVNRALGWVVGQDRLTRWKEQALLGHTLLVRARRR